MHKRDVIAEAISQRTASLAADWLPQPPLPLVSEGESRTRWTAPAFRGLLLLLAICVGLAAWWWWSGRPQTAVLPVAQVATGSPLAGTPAPEPVQSPDGAPHTLAPVPSPPTVVVHVIGQVRDPGLVTLSAGSRVADAIQAAGGVTRARASSSVNLARLLVDGEQIAVGVAAAAPATISVPGAPVGGVLDLNSATAAMLEGLPGVGPVLAGRIVQWRTDNGPFRSVEELGEVSGIGDSILAQLRSQVRV